MGKIKKSISEESRWREDPIEKRMVARRIEFVTADAARWVRVFPLSGTSIGGVGVDVAMEFAN